MKNVPVNTLTAKEETMMTLSRIPKVHVTMSVYDYADLLRKYAPTTVAVWHSPSTGELKAGRRDTVNRDVTLPRNGTMCLDDDLDTLFGLVDGEKEDTADEE